MAKSFLALCAFLAGALVIVATETSGFKQVDVPGQGPVFVWSPEEMDKLDNVLAELLNQRDRLTKQLANCRAGT